MSACAAAQGELREALFARRVPGGRVTYHARIADRIVRTHRHLERSHLQHAIGELERVRDRLPAPAAEHVGRALEHAREALAAIEAR
jgi:hypothetical protein